MPGSLPRSALPAQLRLADLPVDSVTLAEELVERDEGDVVRLARAVRPEGQRLPSDRLEPSFDGARRLDVEQRHGHGIALGAVLAVDLIAGQGLAAAQPP